MRKLLQYRNAVSDILFWIGLILIGFGAADFFSLEGELVSVGCVFILLSLGFQGFPRIKPLYLIACLVFGVSYVVFVSLWFGFKSSEVMHFFFWPLTFFLCGCCSSTNKARRMLLVLTIVIAYTLRCFYLVMNSILYQGFYFNNHLTLTSVTDGKMIYISRNGLSLLSYPMFSSFLFALSLNKGKKETAIKIITGVLAALSVTFAMVVGNRAFLVVALVSGVLYVSLYLARIRNKKTRRIVIGTTLTLLTLVFLFYSGFLPIPDFLLKIPVIKRILSGGSNSERFKLYIEFFAKGWKHPFGGLYNELGRYVHNFYLDIYNFGGIVPFVAFGIPLFVIVKRFATTPMLNAKENHERENLFVAFCFLVPLIVLGFFEPVIHTDGVVASIFFYFFGLTLGTPRMPCAKADLKRSEIRI